MLAASPGFAIAFEDLARPGVVLMARDAADLEAVETGRATPAVAVRWFRWERPTISLGRGQDPALALDLARCAADGVPVVVRPTGGRAVFHADEWTYAALVPLAHPALGGPLAASCRGVVAWIAGALADAYGIQADTEPASAAGPGKGPARGACFGRSFGYELCAGGRKLMGSAQRRGRTALLQQGSLLVGPGQERLARYLRTPGSADPAAAERTLAQATTDLVTLLGRRPDPAAFERAFRARGEQLARAGARMW